MSEALHARVGRTLPNPLFGALVSMGPGLDTTMTGRSDSDWRARWQRLRGAPAFAALAPFALLLAALWPHLAWIARRLTDGSDEPWGVLALATVLVLLWRERASLCAPAPRALAASGALALAAAAALCWLPALLAAAIAMLALAVFVTAALPRRPAAPLATLLLLALPLIASLQFYLGFPLRVATAHAVAPLLALLGIEAQPAGAALVFRTTTVLIDAPCAGIGMLWVGAYTAALLSYLNGASAGRTLANGAGAAAIVFAANVLRNAALFFPEAGLIDAPAVTHDAVGLVALALAIVPIVWLTHWRAIRAPQVAGPSATPIRTTALQHPALVRATFVGACLAAAVVPLFIEALSHDAAATTRSTPPPAIEWPTTFRSQPLTQLALTPLEARFAQRFPGAIARFAAGREVLLLRHVTQPTRQLHPASDCFRAAGFAISPPRASTADDGSAWRCFVATRDGARLRVCERIASADGAQAWTDASAWFWSALQSGPRGGPWWATTVITPLDNG